MFCDSPFFEPADNHLMLFVGDLNEEELEDYLDEPGGRGDDYPQSDFGRDLGRWYDHDFIYAEGTDAAAPARQLCEQNHIDDDDLIEEIVSRCGNTPIQCFVILWNAKPTGNSMRRFADGRITFRGSWQHESPLTDQGTTDASKATER